MAYLEKIFTKKWNKQNKQQAMIVLLPSLAFFLSNSIYADEAEKIEQGSQSKWSSKITYSLSDATGNSEVKKEKMGLSVKYQTDSWGHLVTASRNTSEANGRLAKYNKVAKYIVNYGFDDKNYIFNFLGFYADKKAKIESRWMNIIGYERHFFINHQTTLMTRLGLGVREIEYFDVTSNAGEDFDEKFSEKIAYVGVIYTGKLTDTITLTKDLNTSPGDELKVVESVTSLNVAMSKWLSLELKYKVLYRNNVPPGTDKRDTTSSVSFVLIF